MRTGKSVAGLRVGVARAVVVALLPTVGVVTAAQPAAATSVIRLDAGLVHNCAVTGATVSCWGFNAFGQLGDGTNTSRSSPVAVDTSGVLHEVTLTQISAGALHTCASSSAGTAYCWGFNLRGQLGDGTTTNRSSPVAVDTSGVLAQVALTEVSAGAFHTCALSSAGAAYCWGDNSLGQLGDGTTTNRSSPVAVDTSGVLDGVTLVQISARVSHTCALSSAGAAYCWGDNSLGQLGDGTTTNRSTPVAVDTTGALNGVTLAQIGSGVAHMCALSSAGAAYCWGDNSGGQLGDGTTTNRSTPVAVDTTGVLAGVGLVQLTGGYRHTCATSSAGAVYCWGDNTTGELGDGTTTSRSSPVATDVFPATPPAAPTGVRATAGDGQLVVEWLPAYVGSGTLTGYIATANATGTPTPDADVSVCAGGAQSNTSNASTRSDCQPPHTCITSGATTCTITGLTNATNYTVTVRTQTTDGASAASEPSNIATPAIRPALALPDTGLDLTGTIVLGLGLLTAGIAALAALRRRVPDDSLRSLMSSR